VIDAGIDIIRKPGLAYQEAFDWLAVRLHAMDGPVACSVAADWQLAEMARRLPRVPTLHSEAAGRELFHALGLPEPEISPGLLGAIALVEPAKFPPASFERLKPGGRLFVVAGGRLARFLAERRGRAATSPMSERALVGVARGIGFRVIERLGIHPPAAVLHHYAGEAALALGRRDWRDRCHCAMRRDFVTVGPLVSWSALVCLTLEYAG